ncbi:MAG: hypothetical protein K2X01_08980 [Cyanobacteria bacterium]|nr:hypothetical protein [Cyanobacteriota bacterium]
MQSPVLRLNAITRFFLCLLFLLVSWGCLCFAQQQAIAQQTIAPQVQVQERPREGFTVFKLQPGTALYAVLQTPINTTYNQVNDPVEAIIAQDIFLDTEVILNKNTKLLGHISRLEPPVEGRNAIVCVQFSQINLNNGDELPIKAHIQSERPDQCWGGELTPGTKPRKITHRVTYIGEYNKIVWVGPRQMGRHMLFQPGERWTVILDSPLSVFQVKN